MAAMPPTLIWPNRNGMQPKGKVSPSWGPCLPLFFARKRKGEVGRFTAHSCARLLKKKAWRRAGGGGAYELSMTMVNVSMHIVRLCYIYL